MVSFEAKIKIDGTEYSIFWDFEDKISIPLALTAVLTSEEMIQLVTALRALKFWMSDPSKKKIVMDRDE